MSIILKARLRLNRHHGNIFNGEAVVILVFMSDLSFIQKRTVQIRDVKADFLWAKMKTK